jgi:ferredoxin-NADP reductase
MTGQRSSLKSRKLVAEETMEFVFERPAGFEFKAGQNMDITIPNPPETDDEGATRTFSIASSPSAGYLAIATRMRDTAFKRSLKNMPLGSEILIEGPYGDMTLQENAARPAVFLAGGIGITPFVSMITDATEKKLSHKIFLFYSNRRPEDAPFLEELRKMETLNWNFKMIVVITNAEGYLDEVKIRKYIDDVTKPIYYLAGPPTMTGAMHKMLAEMKVREDDIRMEEFAGY